MENKCDDRPEREVPKVTLLQDYIEDMKLILNSYRSGSKEMDNRRIYRGSENRIRMLQKYTRQFRCSFDLGDYPFDTQV